MPDSGPEEVVHEGTEMVSSVQPEVVETEQSPQLEIIKMIKLSSTHHGLYINPPVGDHIAAGVHTSGAPGLGGVSIGALVILHTLVMEIFTVI